MSSIRGGSPINEDSHFSDNSMSYWHWLVIFATSMGSILVGILPHSFGTIIAYFKGSLNNTNNMSFFAATQFQLDWLPALSSAIPCILLPLFAFIANRLNRSYQILSATGFVLLSISCGLSSLVTVWPVFFFTYSFIYSLGSSLFYGVIIIIIAEYFPIHHKFHVLATSLFQIGYPAASLIGNPIFAVFLTNYGWQTSLKAVSLFEVLSGVIISFLLKPIREKNLCKYDDNKSDSISYEDLNSPSNIKRTFSTTSLNYVIATYELWPWLIGKYLNYMCWYSLRTNAVTYLMRSSNFGLEKSATLMSIYAASEIVVAVLASLFGDKFRGFLIHIHIMASIMLAILTSIFTVTISSYLSAIIIMVCVGIAMQFSLSFGYPASIEVLKMKFDMKTSWGLTNIAAGLGILTSPFFSGSLMDNFGLKSMFYAQCCAWIMQVILFSITLLIMKYKERKLKADYIELPLEN